MTMIAIQTQKATFVDFERKIRFVAYDTERSKRIERVLGTGVALPLDSSNTKGSFACFYCDMSGPLSNYSSPIFDLKTFPSLAEAKAALVDFLKDAGYEVKEGNF